MKDKKNIIKHYEDLIVHYKGIVKEKDEEIKELTKPVYARNPYIEIDDTGAERDSNFMVLIAVIFIATMVGIFGYYIITL